MALARTIRFPLHVFGVSPSCLVESQWKSPFGDLAWRALRRSAGSRVRFPVAMIDDQAACLKASTAALPISPQIRLQLAPSPGRIDHLARSLIRLDSEAP